MIRFAGIGSCPGFSAGRAICGISLLALVLLMGLAAPARAALTLCNRTSYVLYAATAANEAGRSDIRGWTRLPPGECQVARREALTARSYLVYARSSLGHAGPSRAWGGAFQTCVKDGNFVLRLKNGSACTEDGSFALPFAAVNTGGQRDWTMNLDEDPPYPSLTAAQLAGAKRLLADNGYSVGEIDSKPNPATGTALAAFRKKAALSVQAGNTELFQALEDAARKAAGPEGYTVCNDTRQILLVALGLMTAGRAGSQGWWMVEGGACARVITQPLNTETVWLAAQTRGGATVVGGAEKFCVASAAFDIKDRGNCAGRGFGEAGFARTRTAGRSGFVAHIGAGGLAPPGPPQATMSK